MKLKFPFTIIALFATVVCTLAASNTVTVAVFDFESKDDLGSKVSTLLNLYLSTTDNLILVERSEIEKALGEQELGLSGTVSTESAARVGHLIGAKVLVTGKILKVDKDLILVAKVIGTETSRVYGEMAKGPTSKPIDDITKELSEKISTAISTKVDTLVAKVLTREDRVETLKKQIKDTKLPAVSVKIAERHFGGQVIDPAAETEFSVMLQQCGFTLVDENSAQKPDIEITGEAFSAFGMRRGNLNSCKARVEIKIQRKADGKILAVDRQTSVAVDIAEQTAAKTALQEAAAEMASRLIPQLIKAN